MHPAAEPERRGLARRTYVYIAGASCNNNACLLRWTAGILLAGSLFLEFTYTAMPENFVLTRSAFPESPFLTSPPPLFNRCAHSAKFSATLLRWTFGELSAHQCSVISIHSAR